MEKEMKAGRRYLLCNLDEPYAPEVLRVIIDNSVTWNEPTDFVDWCNATYGGCFLPWVNIADVNLPLNYTLKSRYVVINDADFAYLSTILEESVEEDESRRESIEESLLILYNYYSFVNKLTYMLKDDLKTEAEFSWKWTTPEEYEEAWKMYD